MRSSLTLIVFFLASISYGQDLRIEVGYCNLYSKQFDHLIKTYNFSRPFLTKRQPLLSDGFHSGMSYLFKSEKYLKSGLNVNYSLIRSRAENPGFDVKLAFQLVQMGYFLHYKDKDRFGDFYSELGLNAALGLLTKKQNNEPYQEDDKRIKSFQAGVGLSFNLGYVFELSEKFNISPFVAFHYSPYFMDGQSEIVINQTSDLIVEKEQYTTFFKFDAGLRFNFSH